MPGLMMMTSILSEELLARDTHTDRLRSSMLKFAKLLMTLQTKNSNISVKVRQFILAKC